MAPVNPVVPTPSAGPANANINASSSYASQNRLAPVDVGQTVTGTLAQNGNGGFYFDARAFADLDGDGVLEMIVAPGQFTTTVYPVVVFAKAVDGSWQPATASYISGVQPGQQHARKVILADFNGDGNADVFVADHGYDALVPGQLPGWTSTLMLSDARVC